MTKKEKEKIYNLKNSTKKTIEKEKKRLLNLVFEEKVEMIKQDINLKIFIKDVDADVRIEVAKRGYRPEKLALDSDWQVRAAVVKSGYKPKSFLNDSNSYVRKLARKKVKSVKPIKNLVRFLGITLEKNSYKKHQYTNCFVLRNFNGLPIYAEFENGRWVKWNYDSNFNLTDTETSSYKKALIRACFNNSLTKGYNFTTNNKKFKNSVKTTLKQEINNALGGEIDECQQ